MKQKLLSTILSLLMLSSLLLVPAALAEELPVFSLTTDTNRIGVDGEVTVTIAGSGLQDVFAYEFHLYYDSELLEPKLNSVASPVGGMTVPAKVYQGDNNKDYILLAHTQYESNSGQSGDVTFFTLSFQAKKQGNAELELNYVKLIDSTIVTSTPEAQAKTVVAISNQSTTAPPSTPAPQGPVLKVEATQLSSSASTVALSVPKQVTEIQLPYDTAALMNGKSLQLSSEVYSISIPSGVFTQLTRMANTPSAQDVISIQVLPSSEENDQSKYVEKARGDMAADVVLGSHVYDISIQFKLANDSVISLSNLDYPITLSLATVNPIDPARSGIYYFPETDESIEYVDSLFGQNWMTANLNHLSDYAVLQISKSFTDVASNHWARSVIEALYAKQIIKGVTATSFDPGRSITRAEFTAMLVRALKLEGTMPLSFKDVKSSDWFAQEISAAMAAGIINGKSSDQFDPHASITREEMAAVAVRSYEFLYGEYESNSNVKVFKDASEISRWAVQYVNQAASLEIVKGRSGDRFAPKATLTRAESAQVLHNLLMH